MRHLIITLAMVAVALAVTFGVGAMLENSAFKTGPEPGIGAPTGAPPSAPGDRRGRSLRHVV